MTDIQTPKERSEEIYLYHHYMYGSCECLNCDAHKKEMKRLEEQKDPN